MNWEFSLWPYFFFARYPLKLWEWKEMSDDINYRQRKFMHTPNWLLKEDPQKYYLLSEIESWLQRSGSSLPSTVCHYRLLTHHNLFQTSFFLRRPITTSKPSKKSMITYLFKNLNTGQEEAYRAIVESVQKNIIGKLIFVQGHGGTGNTFLWKKVCAKLRSEGKRVLTVG